MSEIKIEFSANKTTWIQVVKAIDAYLLEHMDDQPMDGLNVFATTVETALGYGPGETCYTWPQ